MPRANIKDPTSPRPWRCRECFALLGIQHGAELHVKYKNVQHWIAGRCRHTCRRCGAMNTLHVGPTIEPLTAAEGGAQ